MSSHTSNTPPFQNLGSMHGEVCMVEPGWSHTKKKENWNLLQFWEKQPPGIDPGTSHMLKQVIIWVKYTVNNRPTHADGWSLLLYRNASWQNLKPSFKNPGNTPGYYIYLKLNCCISFCSKLICRDYQIHPHTPRREGLVHTYLVNAFPRIH